MLGYFTKWKIVKSTNKITSNKDFDDINNTVLDVISDNMAYLVQIGKYGEIDTTGKKRWDIMLLNTCQKNLNYKSTQQLMAKYVNLGNFLFGNHTSGKYQQG